jgi:hypothetical protein
MAVCEGAPHNVVEVAGICVGCGGMTIHQPPSEPKPAQVIRKDEEFTIKVWVGHSELLGDLETDYVANLYCHNVATGGVEASYSKEKTGKLDVDQKREKFKFKFKAGAVGVFRHYFCIAFPKSDLATFVHGPVFFVFE